VLVGSPLVLRNPLTETLRSFVPRHTTVASRPIYIPRLYRRRTAEPIAFPTSRRIASGRVSGPSCCAIQPSKAANSAGGIRTWIGVAPTKGLPRPRFFLVLDIAGPAKQRKPVSSNQTPDSQATQQHRIDRPQGPLWAPGRDSDPRRLSAWAAGRRDL